MTRSLLLFCACGLVLLPEGTSAQDIEAPSVPEMRTFQLVLVRPEPGFREPDAASERLASHRMDRLKTAGNLYLDNLVKDQVAVVAGPLPESEEIQQIAILDRDSIKDAEFVFEQSPAVSTGRLRLEFYHWTAEEGVLRRPKDPYSSRLAQIGLLYVPHRAPKYPQEQLEEIEAGHRAHLEKMREMGELVIAGVIDKGDDLREVLIFRARTADRIEELVAQDPAIVAGRLRLELHTWKVAVGSWPRPHEQGVQRPKR